MQFETKCRDCRKRVTLDTQKIDFYAINEAWSIQIDHDQDKIHDRAFLEYASGLIGAEGQAYCPECGNLMELGSSTKGMPVEAWPPVLQPEIIEQQANNNAMDL